MSSSLHHDKYLSGERDHVTAVLGPTNTGKTHYALERMLAHQSGMIGLPLRLLAREIYDRIVAIKGPREVALVTGEEKIIPKGARYWAATVEAMPLERQVEFMAVDEVQLAADPERGRIFTSRILHARGRSETLLLGSDTMRPILQQLFSEISFLSRDRFSKLTYAGPKKVSRLPRRSTIVAFSTDTVYQVAELIRRQRGGAAVVLGALSPRTRNAQAELYQSGDVDYLVATDAIGMGLNMDIDHVAFTGVRKFDGQRRRNLTSAEIAQIAGRAGRHIRDGSFGVTGDCQPLSDEIIADIEEHQFPPVTALQWRSENIDLSTIPALMNSLNRAAPRPEFVRSRRENDEDAFHRLIAHEDVRDIAKGGSALATLWDICQIPDFRKITADQHSNLLRDIYLRLMNDERLSDPFLEKRINPLDRVDGDLDTISARIAHIRTWTYLSHRKAWLQNAAYWQERARAIEDKLSDALHEKLTQRFVDQRTSTLVKRLKDDTPLLAGVTDDGEVIVEGQFVGRLLGFEFIVDPRASGAEAKSLRAAGEKALRPLLAARAATLANADAKELTLQDDGSVFWRSAQVAKLQKGPSALRPEVIVSGLTEITPNLRHRVQERLSRYISTAIEEHLAPLLSLETATNDQSDEALSGLTKGIAFRLLENFGATSRSQFGDDLKQLDQNERAKLRKLGVRFGEYTIFVPALLKPAAARLLAMLWALANDKNPVDAKPPTAGLVSVQMTEHLPHAFYYATGYRPSGQRGVRIDMLERLAGLIRTARSEAKSREGFESTSQMMSLVGCSGEEFEAIMRSLGLRKHVVKRPVEAKAPDTPDAASPATEAKPDSEETKEDIAVDATPETNAATENPATPSDPLEAKADAEATPPLDQSAAQTQSETAEPEPQKEVEVALWRQAPRKHPNAQNRNHKKADDGKNFRGKKGKAGENRRKGGNPKHNAQKGRPKHDSGPMHKPRHRKVADPDSPFAVLAGLKPELSSKGKQSKESEKA